MNDCCSFLDDSNGKKLDKVFTDAIVSKDLERYRKHGPRKSSRILISLLEEHRSTQDVSLCDIGSGIGSVAQAFLNYDAITVDVVESSSAYITASQEEASHQGNRSRIAYHHGDYVHLAHELGPRDLMCLDRVICCYPNMDSLVGLSAMNTKSLLAIVIPRDSIFHRALMKSLYLSFKIWGIFRTSPVVPRFYVHRITDIEDTIKWCGLDRLASKTTFFWRIALYQRSQP